MKRGDVVLADISYSDRQGSKVRPAVIVSTDRNNGALDDLILAPISRTTRANAFTHVRIDPATSDGKLAGLNHVCYIQCENIAALDKNLVVHRLGSLTPALMQQLVACLKAALELPYQFSVRLRRSPPPSSSGPLPPAYVDSLDRVRRD